MPERQDAGSLVPGTHTHADILGGETPEAGHVLDHQGVVQAEEFDIGAGQGLLPRRRQAHFLPPVVAAPHEQQPAFGIGQAPLVLCECGPEETDDLAHALARVGELLVVVQAEAIQVLE